MPGYMMGGYGGGLLMLFAWLIGLVVTFFLIYFAVYMGVKRALAESGAALPSVRWQLRACRHHPHHKAAPLRDGAAPTTAAPTCAGVDTAGRRAQSRPMCAGAREISRAPASSRPPPPKRRPSA